MEAHNSVFFRVFFRALLLGLHLCVHALRQLRRPLALPVLIGRQISCDFRSDSAFWFQIVEGGRWGSKEARRQMWWNPKITFSNSFSTWNGQPSLVFLFHHICVISSFRSSYPSSLTAGCWTNNTQCFLPFSFNETTFNHVTGYFSYEKCNVQAIAMVSFTMEQLIHRPAGRSRFCYQNSFTIAAAICCSSPI